MEVSASVRTGRARPKVSTTSRVTLGTSLPLTSRKLKESSCKFFVVKNWHGVLLKVMNLNEIRFIYRSC